MGTNRLTTRNRGLHGFGLWFSPGSAAIGRDDFAEKTAVAPAAFNALEDCCPMDKESLFDYSVVVFSQ